MNKRQIRKVANAIFRACMPNAKPKIGFNMAGFMSRGLYKDMADHCKTTACIAGWACFVDRGTTREPAEKGDRWGGYRRYAQEMFDLECDTAQHLFGLRMKSPLLEEIPAEQAVATLLHLADTGSVDWEAPLPEKLADKLAAAREKAAARA